jgi:cell wall assembly regulator SMI1
MSPDRLAALLLELEQAWAAAGDPETVARLAPGLTREEILDAAFALPLTLHPDAVTWFSWHNGPRPGETSAPIGASWMQFMSMTRAVAWYYHRADQAAGVAMDEGISKLEAGWDPQWFPVATAIDGTTIAIDCSADADSPAPIRSIYGLDHDKDQIDFASLAELVQAWIDLYAAGVYTFVDGTWHTDDDRMPDAMSRASTA